MIFGKQRKPVTKKIWSLLRYLPVSLRKHLIRKQFEICYDLSSDYVFKQAETKDEVEQALKIVHENYTFLGYIDQRPEQIHFNAFLCLPTTTILIIKHKDEVIGTMSIVPDSSLGLPSEATWDLKKIKTNTMRLAEVSALSIKRSHKLSRGRLLLTFCKFLYEYSVKTLHLDGVVFAATLEVEPFYTDVLLFETVVEKTGQRHELVKGNRSTCCFLDFNKVRTRYIEEYGSNPKETNLYHFFTGYTSPNFQIADDKISMQGLLHKKNLAVFEVLTTFPTLKDSFSSEERLKLSVMDPTRHLQRTIGFKAVENFRELPRMSIRSLNVQIFDSGSSQSYRAILTEVSTRGFGVKFSESHSGLILSDEAILTFKSGEELLSVHAQLRWRRHSGLGYEVSEPSRFAWQKFVSQVFAEIDPAASTNAMPAVEDIKAGSEAV